MYFQYVFPQKYRTKDFFRVTYKKSELIEVYLKIVIFTYYIELCNIQLVGEKAMQLNLDQGKEHIIQILAGTFFF